MLELLAGFEERYAISIAVLTWRHGKVREDTMKHFVSQFTTAKYYFIWPFPKAVRAELEKWRTRVGDGTLSTYIPMADEFKRIVSAPEGS